ncbi:MAG: RES family NAD+ phosphorylase [Pseudomonadota bacterium]
MIFIPLQSLAYRIHVPKYATTPTSGAGAGTHGGRLNRIGVNALYLSLELETALAEYKQTSTLLPPGLIVNYEIAIAPLVDFRNGPSPAFDPLWNDFNCDWRRLYFNEHIEPPTWVIADMVIAAGAKGILYKSVINGGTNVVLYNDSFTAEDSIVAYDPHHALPANQDSWK